VRAIKRVRIEHVLFIVSHTSTKKIMSSRYLVTMKVEAMWFTQQCIDESAQKYFSSYDVYCVK